MFTKHLTFSKVLGSGLGLALAISASGGETFKHGDSAEETVARPQGIPDNYMVPLNSFTAGKLGLKTRSIHARASRKVGLRLIPVSSNRTQAARELAHSGVIQDGDILLSFHPEWGNGLAYSNIQMGISHAGLAFVDESGTVQSIESPLATSSHLDSDHYQALEYFHVLRPELSPTQRTRLKTWARKILKSPTRSHLAFDSNYDRPEYDGTLGFVQKLAAIANGKAQDLSVYCSEFVFALLALRDCDPQNYKPGCEKPYMEPMSALGDERSPAGLVEGPSLVLQSMKLSPTRRERLLKNDLLQNHASAAHMSPGHRKTAESTAPLINALVDYYSRGEPAPARAQINKMVKPNYSPASYLIETIRPGGSIRYVGTVQYK